MLSIEEVTKRMESLRFEKDRKIAAINATAQEARDSVRKQCHEALVKWRRVLRALEAEPGGKDADSQEQTPAS